MKKTIALLTAVILLAVACCSCGGSTKKTAEVVDIQLTSEEYAFADDPNDADLLTKVNAFLLCQLFCLFDQSFHRNTAVISADLRDDTVRTVFVTAFCNLQIFIKTTGCDHTFSRHLWNPFERCKYMTYFSFQGFVYSI